MSTTDDMVEIGARAIEALLREQLAHARAEGYAEAKEQAAALAFNGRCRCGEPIKLDGEVWWHVDGTPRDHVAWPSRDVVGISERIRAMTPETKP